MEMKKAFQWQYSAEIVANYDFDLCSDVLNSEECQTKSFSLLNVSFFQSHFQVLYHQKIVCINQNMEIQHSFHISYNFYDRSTGSFSEFQQSLVHFKSIVAR